MSKPFSSEVIKGVSRQITEPAIAYQLLCIYQGTGCFSPSHTFVLEPELDQNGVCENPFFSGTGS